MTYDDNPPKDVNYWGEQTQRCLTDLFIRTVISMQFSNFLLSLPNNKIFCDLNIMATSSKASMSFNRVGKHIKYFT